MKLEFNTCDRCGANSQSIQQSREFEIHMIYDDGSSVPRARGPLKPLDICSQCARQFIHWFGEINPLTGMYLVRPEDV